jgi:serine/threonine protein kinase
MLRTLDDIEMIDSTKILGEGAFSEVFRVRSKVDGRIYALKQINLSKLSKPDFDNLQVEIGLHRPLDHPRIIRYVDTCQTKNFFYILLECAQNGCLFFYISPTEGLPEALAMRFFYQTCQAVKYLHDHHIIHRDIKPENLLLDEHFNIKLCDFGWSCRAMEYDIRTSICGTYEYMSPEIVVDQKHGFKVDIWCLGIMLYEFLHGEFTRRPSLQRPDYAGNSRRIPHQKD